MRSLATLLVILLIAPSTVAQDADGDGVPSTLELGGFRWVSGPDVFEACVPDVDDPCFVTDPLSWSSDGDPYSDGQEASGVNMDNTILDPYNSPLVAAYPVIEVALNSYSFTPLVTIDQSEGGSVNSSNSFTYGVETTASASVTAGLEATFPDGLGASVETTASFSETVSYSSTRTSGVEFNWATASTVETGDAAELSLSVTIANGGGASARNVRPRFNVYIGTEIVATVLPDEADAIQVLDPGAETAPFTPDGAAGISLSFDQLQALQLGAPVTIEVVEIFADIRRWTAETSNWSCGEIGQETCSWSNFQSQILPRTLRLLVDFGYTGDPSAQPPIELQRNPYEFRVYTGSPNSNPENTLRDVLSFIAEDNPDNGGESGDDDPIVEPSGDGLAIAGRPYPGAWLLTAQVNENGFSPVLDAWMNAGEPESLLDVVMPTNATLLMASPDPDDPGPIITATTFTKDLLAVRAAVTAKGSLPVVSGEARLALYGGTERTVPLAPSADGSFWTTEASGPFLFPAGVESSYVVFTDLSGATRATSEPLGLPLRDEPLPTQCGDVVANDRRPNSVVPGFEAILFVDSDPDTPVEVLCDSDAVDAFFWVPKATELGQNGLYGAVFVDERTALATGTQSIIRSTDGGRTWVQVDVEGLSTVLWDIDRAPDTGTLVAVGGSDASTFFRSTDDGATWTAATPTFSGTTLAVGYAYDETWYAVGENGVKVSSDDGLTWADAPNAPEQSGAFVSVAFRDAQTGMLLDEGTGTGGTGRSWRTSDGGQTWEDVIGATGATDVTYAGDDTWYVTQNLGDIDRVLRSRQNGIAGSWDLIDVPGASSLRSASFVTADLGYVAGSGGVYRTADGGETWDQETSNGAGYRAVAAYDANRSLVVGINGRAALTTSGGGFPATVPVAGEEAPSATVPATFRLDAAYPNPFRDRATIAYSLETASDVSLTVYDVLGRRVARLVDGPKTAGTHTAAFDGSRLAAGVYVIRLLVGGRTETRRMTLLP